MYVPPRKKINEYLNKHVIDQKEAKKGLAVYVTAWIYNILLKMVLKNSIVTCYTSIHLIVTTMQLLTIMRWRLNLLAKSFVGG